MQEAGWIALARMVEDAPSLVVLEANCNLELMRPAEIPAVAKAIASAVGRSKSLTSVDLSSQEWKNGEASGLLPQLLDCKGSEAGGDPEVERVEAVVAEWLA